MARAPHWLFAALAAIPLHLASAAEVPTTLTAARFVVHQPAHGVGETAAEPTAGYNPKTGRAMFIAGLETLRVTFPDNFVEQLPESCDAEWENVSPPASDLQSFDPILFTDQVTGRTFVSQLLVAAGESTFAYSDDDGEIWVPSNNTLSGGIDHQAVGGGPYATLPGTPAYPHAIYYCSQSLLQSFCIRSDDGGLTFSPPIPLSGAVGTCSAIHGHIKVSADGTVYIPVPSCSGMQGVMVSEDDGVTWEARKVTDSTVRGSNNPSIAIATDETLYYCYEDVDGHPHVAVSHDSGLSWENDTDLGLQFGIENSEFHAAEAGDPDRAACGFLGTTEIGNSPALDFPGIWYPYVATTYDGGKTWNLENVSPDDPVQGVGGIWEGGGGPLNRNLLDFNDMDIDEQGRILFTYADGCMGGCRLDPTQNSFSAKATLARQSGGRRLFAAFDPPETGRPAAACLSGARDASRALIRWRVPDSGGEPITAFRIYRGDSAENLKPVAEVGADRRGWLDTAVAGDGEAVYRVAAVNDAGEGEPSNVAQLAVGEIPLPEDPCSAPGVHIIRDPEGDARARLPLHDVLWLSVAEPLEMEGKLVVTLKIANLAAPQPSTLYEARIFKDDANAFYLGMDTRGAAPRFVYGTIALTSVVLVGVSEHTELGVLDAASGYDAAAGTVTLVMDKAALAEHFDVAPGRAIILQGAVRAITPDPSSTSALPLDSTGKRNYFFRDEHCRSLSAIEPGIDLAEVAPSRALLPSPVTDQARFGGALGWPLLLGLVGFARLRRR